MTIITKNDKINSYKIRVLVHPLEILMAAKDKKTTPKQEGSFGSELIQRFKTNPLIYTGTIILTVIIVIVFVFPAMMDTQHTPTLGYYNKVPITYVHGNYLDQVYQSIYRQYQSQLSTTNYQIAQYQIWREAFEATVLNTAVLDEMKKAGYEAPEAVVNKAVAELPEFQQNGVFSLARYNQLDSSQRTTLWRQVKESLTTQMYYTDVAMLRNPSREGTFISAMASPQRSFDLVSYPVSSYPDSEMIAFVRANPALFRVTHLSRITVTSGEREARQLLTSIQNGIETFEDVARNMSRDYYSEIGGDMGSRMAFELLTEIPGEQDREEIISLPAGSLSKVVKITDNTWAFFRIEENTRPADTDDPIIMDKIRGYMLTNERGRAEDWVIRETERFIASARTSGFASAAAQHVLDVKSFGPLPLNYGDVSFFASAASSGISELYYAGTNERFWQACFSTPLNTPSSPVVTEYDVIVIYPKEETMADEEDTSFISMYYSYWLAQSFEHDLRTYFLNNGKLDDRFWDFFEQIMPMFDY